MAHELIDTLNELIQLDINAIRAYDQAIEACEVVQIKNSLAEFRRDHERHVTDLSAHVTALGGTPETRRDLKGMFIEGFTAITSQGDHSALVAMRGNEELTNRKYASVLDKELSPEVRVVVQRNHEDEQRHLAWIKDALDSRMYERKAA